MPEHEVNSGVNNFGYAWIKYCWEVCELLRIFWEFC